jgi:hypothetical protein
MGFKQKGRLGTLCHGKGRLLRSINYASTTQLCMRKRPFSTSDLLQLLTSGEKSGLADVLVTILTDYRSPRTRIGGTGPSAVRYESALPSPFCNAGEKNENVTCEGFGT